MCEPDMEPELDSVWDQDFWMPVEQNLAPLRLVSGIFTIESPKKHWM